MSDTAVHAKGSVLIVDEFDMSNMLSSANQTFDKEYVDTTTFGLGDREGMSGQRGSVLSMEGFRKGTREAYAQAITDAITGDDNHLCAYSGSGMDVGDQVWLVDAIETAAEVSGVNNGAVMLSLAFLADGGARLGKVLHTHKGATATTQNSTFLITVNAATGAGTINFKPTSLGAGGNVVITPGDSAATVKAAIEALVGYGTVTVTGDTPKIGDQTTVAGALSSGDAGADVKGNAFDGDVNTFWSANSGVPAWIGNDLGVARTIASYRVYFHAAATQQPVSWTLEGADDAAFSTNLVTLDTVAGHVIGGAGYVSFTCDAPTSKRYVRMNISALNSGSPPTVRELEFLLAAPTQSSGSYTVEVTAPAVENIPVPTTATSGYSVTKTVAGATLGNLLQRTAAFNGNSVDNGAATSNGATLFLHAIYAAGSGKSLTVEFQDSPDNVTFTTRDTFTTLTNVGAEKRTISGTVARYTRIRIDAGDITGTWAFTAAMSRYE